MKRVSYIFFLLLNMQVFAQSGWRISEIKSQRLDNGLQVILMRDTMQKNVFLSLYCAYRPVTSQNYAGVDMVFAELTGGRLIMDSVYARSLISNPEGLDSALRFIKDVVFARVFSQADVRRVVRRMRSRRDSLTDRIPRLVFYPRDYALGVRVSEYLQAADVMNFRFRFDLNKTTIILAGNLPDSTLKIVSSVFSTLRLETHEFSSYHKRKKRPQGLYFINTSDSSLTVGFVSGFDLDRPIDFVRYKLLETLLRNVYPSPASMVRFSALGSYMGFLIHTGELNESIKNLQQRLKNPAQGLSLSQINAVGADMLRWLDSTVATPVGFEDMIYLILHSGEKPQYLTQLRKKFASMDLSTLTALLPTDLEKHSIPVAIGNELLVGCQILNLSEQFDISFLDTKLYRYKIIKKGFNAWTVIDRYIRFVSPQKRVKNFSYQFDAVFFVDSTFLHLKGYVWKKAPNLYRYQTFVLTATDTLFHRLVIYDGHSWLDSTAMGSMALDSLQAKLDMQQTYILGEMYYRELGYKPELICEPDLLAVNIYKIRVHTGSVYFDELYDMATQTKVSTVARGAQCWYRSFYYYDYRRIRDGRIDFKIPFVIVEQTPRYTLTQTITRVGFRPLRRKIFSAHYYFWPGRRHRPGLSTYISRGFDKIKKLCIF